MSTLQCLCSALTAVHAIEGCYPAAGPKCRSRELGSTVDKVLRGCKMFKGRIPQAIRRRRYPSKCFDTECSVSNTSFPSLYKGRPRRTGSSN